MSVEAEAVQAPKADRWQARASIGILIVCALAALFWPQGDGSRNAPAGMLIDVGGRPRTVASRTAPVTLVHFWSTWCPPCIGEIPTLLRLAADHQANHDFALLMIAVADDPEKVKTFLGDEIDNALFDHDWKVAKSYGTDKLPETHLVVGGRIVESFIGAQNWDDTEIRQRVAQALAAVRDGGDSV